MKFLIFALVIASILEDYGTFQEKPADPKDDELIGLFKKYALQLVKAAVEPFKKSEELMEGGCECLSGINAFEHVNFKDPFLATMSIAKNYLEDLELIHETSESELPQIVSKIKNEMIENIRLILVVLQTSQDEINENSEIYEYTYKKYLVKPNRGSSTSAEGASDDGQNIEPPVKCYRTLDALEYNNYDFILKLDKGFDLVRMLMARDDNENTRDPLWDEVDEIINKIPQHELKIPPPRTKERLEQFLGFLDAGTLGGSRGFEIQYGTADTETYSPDVERV